MLIHSISLNSSDNVEVVSGNRVLIEILENFFEELRHIYAFIEIRFTEDKKKFYRETVIFFKIL